MSVQNLLVPNDYKLYLNVSETGLKLSNIPNETQTTIQSNASTQYTLVFPNKAINANDILGVDNIVGEKVFLKWLNVGSPPELPTDIINCNILNATSEVNTGEITISSVNPVNRINTTFVQPDSTSAPFDVKLFLPSNNLNMVNDSLLYIKSSIFVPNTIEVELDYTKTLPEFNIDIFTTKLISIENNNGQTTSLVTPAVQSQPNINLVLPDSAPTSNQILVAGNNGQLFWGNPTNVIENFKIFNYKRNVSFELNNEFPTYNSPTEIWVVPSNVPNRVYQVFVNYSVKKNNPTGTFIVTQTVFIDNDNYTLVGGFNSFGASYNEPNTVDGGFTFFIRNVSAGNLPVRTSFVSDISQGGLFQIFNFSITISNIGTL
jgi:hypothetical protein